MEYRLLDGGIFTVNLDFSELKKSLLGFYDEQLQCNQTAEGLHIAYPLLLPNGWQIAFSIYESKIDCSIELSDNGLIRNYLENYFPREPAVNRAIIEEKCTFYGIEHQENGMFRKCLVNSLSPLEIQLFAEGLLAVAYLVYRYEKRGRINNNPFNTVHEIFIQNRIPVELNVNLRGKCYNKIYADFKHGNSIVRVVSNRNALATVQIAAFQFSDYKLANHDTDRILIYNPDYHWNSDCQDLAKSNYFDFSAPYTDVDNIRSYIKSKIDI